MLYCLFGTTAPVYIIVMHLRIYLWLSCVVLAGFVRATEDAGSTTSPQPQIPIAPLQNDRLRASDPVYIDDDGSGLEPDESSGSGWGPGVDDEDSRAGSGEAPEDDEDYYSTTKRTRPPTPPTTVAPDIETVPTPIVVKIELENIPRRNEGGVQVSGGDQDSRGAGEDITSRHDQTDINISGEDISPGSDQDLISTGVGQESRPVDNVVYIMNTKPEDRATSFFAQPGMLAAVIGGAVVGLLCAILVVMFIVYRMRKKDEGSYALDEPKRSPAAASYGKGHNNREFYA